MIDTPLSLASKLIKIKSITPNDNGCFEHIAKNFQEHDFTIEYFNIENTSNLFAYKKGKGRHIMFLGHTDVVSEGIGKWQYDPFSGEVYTIDNKQMLYGRGSADMKGADAAMCCGICEFLQEHNTDLSISYLVTSNEEGDGKGGIKDVAKILNDRGLIPDLCIVGEPSCSEILGDTIKNGRRGSITAHFEIHGIQGHVAYAHNAKNALIEAIRLIELLNVPLDEGNEFFPATSFQVTNINAGTGVENVIPGTCNFMCNWRFNNMQDQNSIESFVYDCIKRANVNCTVKFVLNGLPFLTEDKLLLAKVSQAIEDVTCVKPKLSTSGGTSDGRFISPYGAMVIEFGLVNKTIHSIDEMVEAQDVIKLTKVYKNILINLNDN